MGGDIFVFRLFDIVRWRQAFSALGSAPLNNILPIGSCHSGPKAVGACAFYLTRLVCALHCEDPVRIQNRENEAWGELCQGLRSKNGRAMSSRRKGQESISRAHRIIPILNKEEGVAKAPKLKRGSDFRSGLHLPKTCKKKNGGAKTLFLATLAIWVVLGAGLAGMRFLGSSPEKELPFALEQTAEKKKGLPFEQKGEKSQPEPESILAEKLAEPHPKEQAPKAELTRVSDAIRRGESLSLALGRFDISNQEIHFLAKALKRKLNLRSIQPGDVFILERHETENPKKGMRDFDAFEIIRTDSYGIPVRYRAERRWENKPPKNGSYKVETIQPPIQRNVRGLSGKIEYSLYDGVLAAGGDANLVNRIADIYGWQIDFYRETRDGDWFKVLAEENFVDGRFVGYGRVLAAEYGGRTRVVKAFRYESADGFVRGIYSEDGNSLEKTFLKSPLELARITSRYGQRFHPVLKRKKKHNGIDYGAPSGTPFWSVADGTVKEAKYSRTAGKMIQIRHLGGYETEFFHLSRFAKGIKKGAKVRQRQIIGYVGTTGRSTGPHLHYGMKKNSRYVNPSKQDFPAGKAVPSSHRAQYKEDIAPELARLEAMEIAS